MISDIEKNSSQSNEKYIYLISGIATLTAAIIFRRWLASELVLFKSLGIITVESPQSHSILEWFNFIQQDRFIGLVALNFFDIINSLLLGLLFIGLYFKLRKVNKEASIIALIIGLVGIVIYITSNQALAILTLSDQYVTATEAEKPQLLAAGQALLTVNTFYPGGSGIPIGFYLVNFSSLLFAIIMLKDDYFTKKDAYIGIIANGLNVSSIIFFLVAPEFIIIPIPLGSIFLLVWYILIGIKFIKLSRRI